MTVNQLWAFLPFGYCISIAIELPILFAGLSQRHSIRDRFVAGFWLTACTYPIVILVLPLLIWNFYGEIPYLIVAETFAPLAECLLFYFAFMRKHQRGSWMWRDFLVIVLANLASFGFGKLLLQ